MNGLRAGGRAGWLAGWPSARSTERRPHQGIQSTASTSGRARCNRFEATDLPLAQLFLNLRLNSEGAPLSSRLTVYLGRRGRETNAGHERKEVGRRASERAGEPRYRFPRLLTAAAAKVLEGPRRFEFSRL